MILGLKQSDTYESSYGQTARCLLAWTLSPQNVDHWLGLWQGGCIGSVSGWDYGAAPETEKLGWEPIAWRRVGRDCTRWPGAAQPNAAKASTGHSQLCSAPSSRWPPSTFTSCAFLALAARCVCMYSACPFHTLSFPSFVFFRFPWVFFSLLFSCFRTPDLSSHCFSFLLFFFNPVCLIFPSLARHRGCKNAQQLLSWHVLHCLLTVLFLLDFIKTPSAVSSGMVEGVAEEEMEEERRREKSRRFWRRNHGRMAWLTWRAQAATVVSYRRDTGSTS